MLFLESGFAGSDANQKLRFSAQTLEDRYSRDDDFGFADTLYQRLGQSHALVRLIG